MTDDTLTDRQQEVLDMIEEFIDDWGYSPNIREIGDALGISSPNGVVCHLRVLEAKGYITRTPKVARSIVLLE